MTFEDNARRFEQLHGYAPMFTEEEINRINPGPFCHECGDWHNSDEPHSYVENPDKGSES